MNEYNVNNPSEMLHLLVDGELDSSLETNLYSALSSSEELRTELRELISIKESVRNDVEAFTPPVAATQNIFTNLGYSVPQNVGLNVATKTGAGMTMLASLGQKLRNPFISAILASFITALFFLNFFDNNVGIAEENVPQQNNNQNQIAKAEQINTKNVSSVPIEIQNPASLLEKENNIISLYANNSSKKNNGETQNIASFNAKNSTAPPSDDIYQDLGSNENLLASINFNNDFSTNEFFDSFSPSSFINLNNIRLDNQYSSSKVQSAENRDFTFDNYYYPENDNTNKHILTVYVRGITSTSFPDLQIMNQPKATFTNVAFAAFTPITKNIQFGIEVGQESFIQSFYNIENNMIVQYEQNPTMLWGGIAAKFTLDKISYLANLQPYLHLTLASTQIGPLGKLAGGIQFISNSGIGIVIGFEGSSLLYSNQNRWFSTEKIGVTYGIVKRF